MISGAYVAIPERMLLPCRLTLTEQELDAAGPSTLVPRARPKREKTESAAPSARFYLLALSRMLSGIGWELLQG